MFESSCFVCTTIDISPNVHQYNTLTHEFSETPPTSLSQSGIDFNKGIIMIDSIEQGTSYSQRLAFYDDKGLNTFYLAKPEVERLRAVIWDEYIYLGIKLAAQDSFELINEKVITFDKNGNIVDELILPLELDEDSKHNQYYWYVYKGEVKTIKLPENMSFNGKSYYLRKEDNQEMIIHEKTKEYYPSRLGFNFKEGKVFSLLPKDRLDETIFEVMYLNDGKLLVASLNKDIAKKNRVDNYFSAFNYAIADEVSFGIYDTKKGRYIPIVEDTSTLALFILNGYFTQDENFFLVENRDLYHIELIDDEIIVTTSFIKEAGEGLTRFISDDHHLFFSFSSVSSTDIHTVGLYYVKYK